MTNLETLWPAEPPHQLVCFGVYQFISCTSIPSAHFIVPLVMQTFVNSSHAVCIFAKAEESAGRHKQLNESHLLEHKLLALLLVQPLSGHTVFNGSALGNHESKFL